MVRVKLDTSNLVQRLVILSTVVCMIEYPQMGYVQGHMASLNFTKCIYVLNVLILVSDNVLKMVKGENGTR